MVHIILLLQFVFVHNYQDQAMDQFLFLNQLLIISVPLGSDSTPLIILDAVRRMGHGVVRALAVIVSHNSISHSLVLLIQCIY